MLALLALTSGAPTGEGQGQAAIIPGIDPLNDPRTGHVINRWNQLPQHHPGDGHSPLHGGHGLWSPAIDAAAAFCAYRNTKYALDGVWTIKHKDTCAAACNYVNAAGWVLTEEHQLYDSVSNDTNNADVWRNGVEGTSEGLGPSPRSDETDLEYGPNCLIAFHGASPTEGHNRHAVADEAVYETYKGIVGLSKRWTEEFETIQERMWTLHGNMSNFGKTIPGEIFITGHAEGGTVASLFAFLANHRDDPMDFGHPIAKLTVYGVPPTSNFTMENGQREDGCFDGTAYYTRFPKGTPYIDSEDGLEGHLVDIYSILSGYNVTREVQDAVRDQSIFDDLDNMETPIHLKHSIHTRKSKHIKINWLSLDMIGQITDEVEDLTVNLDHLLGPVQHNACGEEPPAFHAMANDPDLAVRAANETDMVWKALTMDGYAHTKCYSRECADSHNDALAHGSDALNMHAPETYTFSLCMLDEMCKTFMFHKGEVHRDIHPN